MKIDWAEPKNLIIAGMGLVGLLITVPKLGDALDYARKVLGTTETAYAAYEQSTEIRSDFDQYLEAQKQANEQQAAVAQAINSYVQQQQQTKGAWREEDAAGRCWMCDALNYHDCGADQWYRCP
jgi:homoserine acetyltransferase